MERRYEVILSAFVAKRFGKLPGHIQKALRTWAELIESDGIWTMRKIPGYHETLEGRPTGSAFFEVKSWLQSHL